MNTVVHVGLRSQLIIQLLLKSLSDDSDEEDDDMPSNPATIMVPMADLLNHVPQHNAELNVGESTFRMIAVHDIAQVGRSKRMLSH